MLPDESRYERGLAKMREMFGPGIDSALKSLAATSPDLVRCLVEFPFGDTYPRPGLDLKTREMLTVAALTVLGRVIASRPRDPVRIVAAALVPDN
jgi:4-carboxymuconolactone decarboxylase